MTLVVIQTGDGSHTLFDTARNIHYRCLHGARRESDYVFVSASRIAQRPAPWRILELGLGTGLNFVATAEAALKAGVALEYWAVEAAPLDPELARQFGHLGTPGPGELVLQALKQVQSQPQALAKNGPLRLQVLRGDWKEVTLPENLRVDAIYHDPFGPKENPEAWTRDCFAWSAPHLDPEHGRLVTYAAATPARRAMVAAGLRIASLPGSGSKREMTVAARCREALADAELLTAARFQPSA